MQSELKPCPFCGGAPHIMHCVAATYMIQCLQCKATTDDGSLDRISANWNRRELALSDKQAGEVKAQDIIDRSHTIVDDVLDMALYLRDCPRENIWKYQDAANRLAAFMNEVRSALVDVSAVEVVGDDLIGYVLRYGGMCRDCADMDGVCQSGQPCDTEQRRAVIKHTIAALAYGIKHGFIASPFQSPHREGEDSAEVERLRGLLDVALDALDSYADPTGYTDNNGEQLPPDEEVHQGLLAKETAANLRAALAATRSASATTQKGCADASD